MARNGGREYQITNIEWRISNNELGMSNHEYGMGDGGVRNTGWPALRSATQAGGAEKPVPR